MKKILTLAFLGISSLAFAQISIPQMDRAKDRRVVFQYQYSVSREGGEFKDVTSGEVTVEDNSYKLDGLGLVVVSDGETRWTQDPSAREIVIESVETDNPMTNPALLVSSYKSFGKAIHVNDSSENSLDVTYTVDEDVKARFVLTDIRYLDRQGKSDFSFDVKSLPEDYIVTDLR